jgi:hypothetical protein
MIKARPVTVSRWLIAPLMLLVVAKSVTAIAAR